MFALSLLGLFDSSYLWWVYTSPTRPLVCLGTGCDVVRASSYAHLAGLPLPIYGAVMYGALALLIFAGALLSAQVARRFTSAILLIAGAGFLTSLYLTGIEAFVLHAWCAWCVLSALVVTVILVLAILEIARPAPHPEAAASLALARTYLALFVATLILAVPAFYLLARRGELAPMRTASAETLNQRLVRPDSHATDNLQSPVTVVEFGDFECPVCGQAEKTVREIRKKYGDQIRFVFRQFPVVSLHAQAEEAAEASECAAEQGKFWEAAEKLYDNQSDLSDRALRRYAAGLGLDQGRFNQCLSGQSMVPRIRRDVADGHAFGVRATPTFFVGQQTIEGAPTFNQFAQLVEQALARHSVNLAQFHERRGEQYRQAGVRPKTLDPLTAGTTPTGNAAGASPGLLGGADGSGFFTQFGKSTLACSEDELKQQQPTLIRTPEARQLFESGAKKLFVDVRPAKDFASARIPGAVNVPVDQIEQRWESLLKDKTIVLYESGGSSASPADVCAAGRAAGRVLLAHGFSRERVKVYQDGLAGWQRAGLPVEP